MKNNWLYLISSQNLQGCKLEETTNSYNSNNLHDLHERTSTLPESKLHAFFYLISKCKLINIVIYWEISEGFVEYVRKRRANQLVDQWPNKWKSRLPHIIDKEITNTLY